MKKNIKIKQPSKNEIAFVAYKLFEEEGRPHGRDFEHWIRAEQLLKTNDAETKQHVLNK
jgi:hypothetical protein